MLSSPSPRTFAAATAPLLATFGHALTLWRNGNVVHWSYDGQTVVVTLRADGVVDATYVDRPGRDEVGGGATVAEYRRTGERSYPLTAAGSSAMVGDMMAFFSGQREPYFTFSGMR